MIAYMLSICSYTLSVGTPTWMLCVLTVISKLKSSAVFFSNRFKNGSLMPRLSLGSGGHVIWVVLQKEINQKD